MPCRENLLGCRALPEQLLPAPGCQRAVRFPALAQPRHERGALGGKVFNQRLRDRFCECALGERAVIAGRRQQSDLVFDLHHQHGILHSVDRIQVLQESRERALDPRRAPRVRRPKGSLLRFHPGASLEGTGPHRAAPTRGCSSTCCSSTPRTREEPDASDCGARRRGAHPPTKSRNGLRSAGSVAMTRARVLC